MKTLKRFFRYERAGWLFVLPGLLYMLVFVGYPIIYNIVLSLQDVTQKNLISGERHFVALKNYIALFHDNVFLHSIGNTLIYTVCCLVLQFVIGFALALFFTKKFSFSKPVRGLLMMPWMIPITVTALMFKFIFGIGCRHPELHSEKSRTDLTKHRLADLFRNSNACLDRSECLDWHSV